MRVDALETALAWLLRASAWIGWLALGLMMVIGTADVVGTALFRKPMLGAFEMAEAALAVVMFLGLVHVQARQSHIVVDLLSARLRGTPKRLADCLALLGTLIALYLVARQTWPLMLDSVRIREVAGGDQEVWCSTCYVRLAEDDDATWLAELRQAQRERPLGLFGRAPLLDTR